jgi:hypothetical protein
MHFARQSILLEWAEIPDRGQYVDCQGVEIADYPDA